MTVPVLHSGCCCFYTPLMRVCCPPRDVCTQVVVGDVGPLSIRSLSGEVARRFTAASGGRGWSLLSLCDLSQPHARCSPSSRRSCRGIAPPTSSERATARVRCCIRCPPHFNAHRWMKTSDLLISLGAIAFVAFLLRFTLFSSSTPATAPLATPSTLSVLPPTPLPPLPAHSPAMSAAELVKRLIAENVVMVFSKSYCPYCAKAQAGAVGLRAEGLQGGGAGPEG